VICSFGYKLLAWWSSSHQNRPVLVHVPLCGNICDVTEINCIRDWTGWRLNNSKRLNKSRYTHTHTHIERERERERKREGEEEREMCYFLMLSGDERMVASFNMSARLIEFFHEISNSRHHVITNFRCLTVYYQ